MTQREKILVGIVGTVVALLLNLFLISFFMKNQRQLRQDLENKKVQMDGMKQLLADRDVWAKRDAALRASQPKLENQATAGVQLLDHVRDVAKKHSVRIMPETLTIGTPERRPQCVAVPINIETTSTWKALINFLLDLQGENKFIVLESANFRKDTADQTLMNAKFRIAKWYAPAE
jgi:hypothetical protein